MESILLSLSLALILGLVATRGAKKIGLPAVTAYLIVGVLLGPFVLGRTGVTGVGFNTDLYVQSFRILTKLALGFIAFTIGNEFRLSDLKKMGKSAFVVGVCESLCATLVVDIVLITLHFLFPHIISLNAAIVLGSIAAATAPAATMMVIKQYKAHGPLTKLLLMVVALDDAFGLMLFSISFGIASSLESGVIGVVGIVVEPLIEIIYSAIFGVTAGFLLNHIEKYFHSNSKRLSLIVGFVMLTAGGSMMSFNIGGVKVGASLLLVCMITGTVFCNICDASLDLMERLDSWSAPLLALFFVLSGAELDFRVFKNPTVFVVGMLYIIFRCVGKFTGAYIGSKTTHCSPQIQKYLGVTLFPQAGVALGMAQSARALEGGNIVANIVLFSVFIYELVGPSLTKKSLIAAGEIDTTSRKSSRRLNIHFHHRK